MGNSQEISVVYLPGSLDWLDLAPKSLNSELLLTSKVRDSKHIYFCGDTSIQKHLVDDTTQRFSISGRTLKLRGRNFDTIIAASRTYPKVKVTVSSRVDQSTRSVAAESYLGLQVDQSPVSNPYYNDLECINAFPSSSIQQLHTGLTCVLRTIHLPGL
jgi:hypothetical protein